MALASGMRGYRPKVSRLRPQMLVDRRCEDILRQSFAIPPATGRCYATSCNRLSCGVTSRAPMPQPRGCGITSRFSATLYRGIASGRYPKPIKVSPNGSRWIKSECLQALRKLAAERYEQEMPDVAMAS